MDEPDREIANEVPVDDTQELIDSAASRPSSETNYLPESNIRYLLRGETGSYNEKQLQEKVGERAERISVRVQRLIYDITALDYGGHLDDINQNWGYLPDLPKHAHWSIRNLQGRDADTDVSNSELQLGFSLGLALSALTGTVTESERASDFLDGILLAYDTDEHHKSKKEDSDTDSRETPRLEINSQRADVLREAEIKPTPFLDRLIEVHNQGWASLEGEAETLPPSKAAEKFVENSLGDSFERHRKLRSTLDTEWNSIQDASVPGAGAQEVLEALWRLTFEKQSSNKMHSEEIAKEMGKPGRYKKTVSHVLNQLSEDGRRPSLQVETTYFHSEIVEWSGQEWEFTDYGRLLAYYVFEKDQNVEWIQRIALSGTLPLEEEYMAPSETAEEILSSGVEAFYDC